MQVALIQVELGLAPTTFDVLLDGLSEGGLGLLVPLLSDRHEVVVHHVHVVDTTISISCCKVSLLIGNFNIGLAI